jgi:hypothetical protein
MSMPEPRSTTVIARLRIPALFVMAIVLGAAALNWYLDRPEIVFLRDDGPARWIVHDDPVELRARPIQEQATLFRIGFDLQSPARDAVLEYVALRDATVYVDGEQIAPSDTTSSSWKQPRRIPIGHWMSPGRHEVAIAVRNPEGPPAVRARCDEIGLASGTGWQSYRGADWSRARLASARPLPGPARGVPSGRDALRARLPILVLMFCAGFAGTWIHHRWSPAMLRWIADPVHLQWVLVAAWIALGAVNFRTLPPDAGFDVSAHMDYIRFIAERGALPLADDGWQMFQMPLFYVLAAIPYRLLSDSIGAAHAGLALRWIPLACGALQILIARRALAAAFPGRSDLQALGMFFAACLPVNLYMSQYVANEPMAALLSAVTLTLLLRILRRPDRASSIRMEILLGLALAGAILSKVTAILLVPVAVGVVVHARGLRAGTLTAARVLLILLAFAGWPFVRNLLEFGTPFVFSSSSVQWWQDPGYRVAEDLWRFGRALDHPVFASTAGFWNAVYSTMWTDGQMSSMVAVRWFPPWKLPFVLAGAWLALPLVIAMIAGAVRGLLRRDAPVVLATICTLLYGAALLQQFLALPIYSTAKAGYTLGLLPLYAVLLTSGLRRPMRSVTMRSLVVGMMVAWGMSSYLGYLAT